MNQWVECPKCKSTKVSIVKRDPIVLKRYTDYTITYKCECGHIFKIGASTFNSEVLISTGTYCCKNPTCPQEQGPPFTIAQCVNCNADCKTCTTNYNK